jgi:hypothetical protein
VSSLNGVQTITVGVLAFFALIAIITLIRIVMNRESSAWRGMRVGFFVERNHVPEEKEGAAPRDPPPPSTPES